MSALYLTIGLFALAFGCVYGGCEWALRRRRADRNDEGSTTG